MGVLCTGDAEQHPSPALSPSAGPGLPAGHTHRPDEAQQSRPGERSVGDGRTPCRDWDSLHRVERTRSGVVHRGQASGRRGGERARHALPTPGMPPQMGITASPWRGRGSHQGQSPCHLVRPPSGSWPPRPVLPLPACPVPAWGLGGTRWALLTTLRLQPRGRFPWANLDPSGARGARVRLACQSQPYALSPPTPPQLWTRLQHKGRNQARTSKMFFVIPSSP